MNSSRGREGRRFAPAVPPKRNKKKELKQLKLTDCKKWVSDQGIHAKLLMLMKMQKEQPKEVPRRKIQLTLEECSKFQLERKVGPIPETKDVIEPMAESHVEPSLEELRRIFFDSLITDRPFGFEPFVEQTSGYINGQPNSSKSHSMDFTPMAPRPTPGDILSAEMGLSNLVPFKPSACATDANNEKSGDDWDLHLDPTGDFNYGENVFKFNEFDANYGNKSNPDATNYNYVNLTQDQIVSQGFACLEELDKLD